MTGRTRRTGTRAKLIAYLREYGPAGVPQIAAAFGWDRVSTMRAVARGLESDTVAVHSQAKRGKRLYMAGEVKPQLPAPSKEPARRDLVQQPVRITRGGSGIVAPLSYGHQRMREILARNESERR